MHTHLIITKPLPDEYPKWAANEIEAVIYNNLLGGLEDSFNKTFSFLEKLSEKEVAYRYAEGKWSIKQMWQHIIDVERVLAYRALRYARKDETVLQGFDQNKYAEVSNADARNFNDILFEYAVVRKSTIALFNSFTEEIFMLKGTAGKSVMTVRALGYLILGHEIHHMQIIQERYLNRIAAADKSAKRTSE